MKVLKLTTHPIFIRSSEWADEKNLTFLQIPTSLLRSMITGSKKTAPCYAGLGHRKTEDAEKQAYLSAVRRIFGDTNIGERRFLTPVFRTPSTENPHVRLQNNEIRTVNIHTTVIFLR
jgi:hypothetical protein